MSTAPQLPLCAWGHVQRAAGGRFCVACGGALLPAAGPGEPACALHPHVRAVQPCGRCGNFACQACLRDTPGGGWQCVTCEDRRGAEDLPWDRREQLGTLRAFFQTCWAILFHPERTLDRVRPDGGAGSSLWFATLAELTTYLTTFLLYGALIPAVGLGLATRGDAPGETLLATVGIGVGIAVGGLAFAVAVGLGLMLLTSALDHLVLKLVGANPRPFEVTLRAHALSLSPALVGLLPYCGLYVVMIWSVVIRVFAYRALHRTSTGKAAAGALLAPGVLMFLTFAGYLAIFLLASTAEKL